MARVHSTGSSVSNELDAKLHRRTRLSQFLTIISSLLAIIFCISTVILLMLVLHSSEQPDTVNWQSQTVEGKFKKAVVVSENSLCSEIGRDILMAGGNAVDATVSALLCIGVVHPHLSGLGGGFLMTVYNRSTRGCSAVDAREMAPLRAFAEMFVNDTSQAQYGYRAAGVPGELHGMWTIFSRYGSGKVPWSRLFDGPIRLARDGYPWPDHFSPLNLDNRSLNMPSMRNTIYNPVTNELYKEGDIVKREELARTLERLATAVDPVELFYRGEMAQEIADEFDNNGGLVDLESLANYTTIVHDEALSAGLLDGYQMCGPPLPSSFVVTQSIVKTMADLYKNKKPDLSKAETFHNFIEAEKFAYAQRMKMGDMRYVEGAEDLAKAMLSDEYVKYVTKNIKDRAQPLTYYSGILVDIPEDHGTSTVTALDEEGNAVVITSTVNTWYGSKMVSPGLGIPWNNEMDDFSTPGLTNYFGYAPSISNYIAPGKRPMSSISPTVVYHERDGNVKLTVGASGGTYIISSVAQTTIRALLFNQTIKESVDGPRFHNQFKEQTKYEQTIPLRIANELRNIFGQNLTQVEKLPACVSALKVEPDGFIYANADYRKSERTYPAGY